MYFLHKSVHSMHIALHVSPHLFSSSSLIESLETDCSNVTDFVTFESQFFYA